MLICEFCEKEIYLEGVGHIYTRYQHKSFHPLCFDYFMCGTNEEEQQMAEEAAASSSSSTTTSEPLDDDELW